MAQATFMESPEPTVAVPIEQWPDGSIRVGGTRTLLATIVTAYLLGESPEEIAGNYGQTPLDQVYAVLAFYLAHREEVDAYLAETEAEAEGLRAQIEREFPVTASRERLRAQLDERRAAGTR
jgi:uncharacterized protein (DUF433 family)